MVRNYCFTLHCSESSWLTGVAVAVVVDSRVFGFRFQHFVVCAYICYNQLPLPYCKHLWNRDYVPIIPRVSLSLSPDKNQTSDKIFGNSSRNERVSRESYTRVLSLPGIGYPSFKLFFQHVASCKRYRNPGYFCLWNSESGEIWVGDSEILGFGIWNIAQGIRNPINDWNPESKF